MREGNKKNKKKCTRDTEQNEREREKGLIEQVKSSFANKDQGQSLYVSV